VFSRTPQLALALATSVVMASSCETGHDGPAGSTSAVAQTSATPTGAPLDAPSAEAHPAREGSAIVVAPGGDALVVADEDHRTLTTVPLPLNAASTPTKIALPGAPAQIVVLGATLLVTIRATDDNKGALLFFERGPDGALTETGRVALPPDAWGIATAPGGRRAIVTSAWTAKVTAVDLVSRTVLWTRDVPREPRGALFTAEGTAFVSHLVGSSLTRIRDVGGEAVVDAVELPAAPMRAPAADKLSASLGYTLVANPSKDRVFAPRHALGTLGTSVWFGAAAVDTLDVGSGKPVAAARTWQVRKSFAEPFAKQIAESAAWWGGGVTDFVDLRMTVFAQPRAAVYRPATDTILVASEGTSVVAEVDALLGDPALGLVRSYGLGDESKSDGSGACTAPSGIALSADERAAYVYCRTSDSVTTVLLAEDSGEYTAPPRVVVKIADPGTDADFAAGRRLFYDASDSYVSGGLACAGCHPEGRDDGYVWHEVVFSEPEKPGTRAAFTNFFGSAGAARQMAATWKDSVPAIANATEAGVGYPRQTPMLVERLKAKGPYGWLAESATLEERIVASFGLHRWNSGEKSAFATARARQLIPFVRGGLVPPPTDTSPLTKEEELGKQIFESERSACSSCHTPETDYTNRSIAAFPTPLRRGYAEEKGAAYKTPSLRFVGGSAPYFHDGRYATLEEIVDNNGDVMGKTSHLSVDEKKALVAFLRRL
jgi:DNA-binding beta-propeller fold protein YncE